MIYADFAARMDAVPYPSAADFPDRAERRIALNERDAELAIIEEEFAAALADEYLSFIPREKRAIVASAVYKRADADGHSEGLSGIENQYIDLLDLAAVAYAAGA